jgi:hypothetical protein
MPVRNELAVPTIETNRLVTKTLKERAKQAHRIAKSEDRERRVAELLPAFEESFIGLLNTAGRVAPPPRWRMGKPEHVNYEVNMPLEGQDPLKVTIRGETFPSDATDEGEVLGLHGFSMSIEGMPTYFQNEFGETVIRDRYFSAERRRAQRPPKPSEVRAYTELSSQLTAALDSGVATAKGIGIGYNNP